MTQRARRNPALPRPIEVAVRLHEAATALALGIGMVKAADERCAASEQVSSALGLLAESLGSVRRLTQLMSSQPEPMPSVIALTRTLGAEARRLGLDLRLEVAGDPNWLPPNQLELILLVGREALRNVRRHSGASACRIFLDRSTCPVTLRVRDWGAGMEASSRAGSGIALARDLASRMGFELAVASQPGLGTELVLIGPRCLRTGSDAGPLVTRSRSEVGQRTAKDAKQPISSGHLVDQTSRLVGR